MAAGLEQEMQTIEGLAERVSSELRRLRRLLAASEEREAELRRALASAEQRLTSAETDVMYLRMSHRLAASPDSIIEARRMLSGLIRNIDKAIADLKE